MLVEDKQERSSEFAYVGFGVIHTSSSFIFTDWISVVESSSQWKFTIEPYTTVSASLLSARDYTLTLENGTGTV